VGGKASGVAGCLESLLAPVVSHYSLIREDLLEGIGLLDEDIAQLLGLAKQDGLQADELQHCEEGADEGAF